MREVVEIQLEEFAFGIDDANAFRRDTRLRVGRESHDFVFVAVIRKPQIDGEGAL